ncbi:DUF4372 domain-containing protein [Chitinophaga sancti]
MVLISHKYIHAIVNRSSGNYKTRDLDCWRQFLWMSFGQLILLLKKFP